MSRDPDRLSVFRDSHELVLRVYRLTTTLPDHERFGLQLQLRRAAVSVSANLVEGSYRRTSAEYARFIDMAVGSAAEVRYLLRLIRDLTYASGPTLDDCAERSDHVVRSLQNLHTAVLRFGR
jgi:four helix bundle protein